MTISTKFVQFIPETLTSDTLYVSLEFDTASHLCFCGCGRKVVTPLSPTDWELRYNGTTSLNPSIGSWSLPCRSHYWIKENRVVWASNWTQNQVDIIRTKEKVDKMEYYTELTPEINNLGSNKGTNEDLGIWTKILRMLRFK